MMRFSFVAALWLGLVPSALSQNIQQSLAASVSQYPDLSTFKNILDTFPSLISAVLDGKSSGVTVLVPTNKAINDFLARSRVASVDQIPVAQLQTVLKYHVMDARLKSSNFTAPRGITVPTVLRDRQYNNRTAGPQITDMYGAEATGQVLFVQKDPIASVSANIKKFRVRQAVTGASASLRAGLAQTATLTAVDGTWDGGSFQVIDTILSPPMPCSTTIRSTQAALRSLDNALNRSGLYPALDSSPNVTCLAPSSAAFGAAGNPDQSLDPVALGTALLFHTLPEVTYTNYLEDGQIFTSLANLTVKVRIVQGTIYFNDAKVVSPNVLTNNGLIHVLDKVMSPNGTAPESPDPTSTSTGSTTSSTSKPNAGTSLTRSTATVGLVAFFVAAAMI